MFESRWQHHTLLIYQHVTQLFILAVHHGFYAGGGLGAALVSEEVKSIAGDTSISGKETGLVPVGTVQAGYRLAGSGDKPMNIDVSYRYLYFLSSQNGLSDLAASSVFVNLSISL